MLAVLVLLACALGADDWTRRVQERQAAERLQQQLDMTTMPTVSLGGWPFVVQAADLKIPDVRVEADNPRLSAPDGAIRLTRLVMTCRELDASGAVPVADGMQAGATIGWDELRRLSGYPQATFAEGGRISVTPTVTLEDDQQLPITVSVLPQLDVERQEIALTDAKITIIGVQLTDAITQQIVGRYAKPIPLPLPDGLRADRLTVAESGVTLRVSGDDVKLGG